jgi:hypothetical protein
MDGSTYLWMARKSGPAADRGVIELVRDTMNILHVMRAFHGVINWAWAFVMVPVLCSLTGRRGHIRALDAMRRLFVAERHHGIDVGCPSCRNQAGDQCNYCEGNCNCGKRERIAHRHAIDQT